MIKSRFYIESEVLNTLPVQSPRARCFERPKLKSSECGVRKDANWEDGRPNPQIHLKKVQKVQASFMSRDGGNGRGTRWLTVKDIWAPAGVQGRLRFLCWPELMWAQSRGSCKSLISNTDLPHLLQRGTSRQGAVFVKLRPNAEL